MSVRFSGKLIIDAVTVVTTPYEVEATFSDNRGIYDETLIAIDNVVMDANKNRYKVTNVISLSPLTLELVWDDLGAPAQPTTGAGIIGATSTNRKLLEVTPDSPTGIDTAARNIDFFKNLDTTLNTITGPVGPPGVTGVQGSGQQGLTGPVGAKGATGAIGTTGLQGSQGSHGATGEAGANGSTGPRGHTGPIGSQGSQGNQGTQGNTGLTGTKGDTGIAGTPGTVGAAGVTGQRGSTGLNFYRLF